MSGGYVPTRRDQAVVTLANAVLRLATPGYRAGIERWRGDGERYLIAQRALSDACTAAVVEDWCWWRPSWSAGRYEGLSAAFDLVAAAEPSVPVARTYLGGAA